MIAATVAGCGLMWTGLFDPVLVTSGQLRKVLTEWSCPGGVSIYAIYRKTPRMPAKIAAFIDFVADAFAAFDPNELNIVHCTKPDRRERRAQSRSAFAPRKPTERKGSAGSPPTPAAFATTTVRPYMKVIAAHVQPTRRSQRAAAARKSAKKRMSGGPR